MKDNLLSITEYLKSPQRSLVREELINYKFLTDLKIEAARRNCYFKIYKPEIDNEGCDFIIEDHTDFSRKIQIKTRVGKTRSWVVHRSILLPGRLNQEDYRLDATICPTYPGAFILVDILEKEGKLNFEYSYTDADILYLIAFGFIKKNQPKAKEKALNILRAFYSHTDYKLCINEAVMIKVRKAESLVYFLAMFQEYDFSFNAHKAIQIRNNPKAYFRHNEFNQEITEEEIRRKLITVNRILKEHAIGF